MELTKKQFKDKLKYLEVLKDKMEKNNFKEDEYGNKEDWSILQKMFLYQKMSFEEKEKLKNKWELYYEAVRHSRAYKRCCEQKKAFEGGDYAKVKELALEARRDLEQKTDWIPKPSSIDPDLFPFNEKCKRYLRVVKAISEIKELLKKMGDEETLEEDSFEEVKEIFNS